MSQPSWIGRTLHGRYKIESLLGSGGMATVYKAFDPNLGRDVAIKLIHPHLAQQPEFVKRFKHEAAAVAKLHHPYIVPVYDFNDDQGVYYMVLAYLTGKSLEKRLEVLEKVGRHLPLSEAIDFMVKICEAVDYAHQQQIIHRDIKPGNVLFDQNGQPYLTDFGIARLAGDQQTMTAIGTPTYMSPEQIRGDQKLDQRSDIYSLGIMLYEMVSGKPPFEGGLGTLMLKHMQEPVPDVRILNSNIPETLVAVIEKALAKDPADRFQSAAEMAGGLRNKRQPTGPTVRVNPASPPTVRVNPPPSPPPPPLRPSKRRNWKWIGGGVLMISVVLLGMFAFFSSGADCSLSSIQLAVQSADSGEAITVTDNRVQLTKAEVLVIQAQDSEQNSAKELNCTWQVSESGQTIRENGCELTFNPSISNSSDTIQVTVDQPSCTGTYKQTLFIQTP